LFGFLRAGRPSHDADSMIRVLTFTTLFPNQAQPQHGVFVENRLCHLVGSGEVAARVLAPVPWFPVADPRFGRYARYAAAPRTETRHGLEVAHPRYPVIPKIGANLAPLSLYQAAARTLARWRRQGYDFDVIDSHFFFPDGIAAVLLGRRFGKPVTITARGTDINLEADHRVPRAMIRWAAARADGLITVAAALKDRLVALGVPAERVSVLRNGVDLAQFRPPADRAAIRADLGLNRRTLLSVGHLIERKGHDRVIGALAELADTELLIAGEGPEAGALTALAARLGVAARVRLLGAVPHHDLARLYGAADALVLASSREGWANVLLEAMACGTPVVATRIWGTPEAVTEPAAGRLVAERTPAALAAGVRALFADPPQRADTRRYAERFGWQPTTEGQLALFRAITARAVPRRPARPAHATVSRP
jgi:glycosyltransferase involved in cell wall biosynthesis